MDTKNWKVSLAADIENSNPVDAGERKETPYNRVSSSEIIALWASEDGKLLKHIGKPIELRVDDHVYSWRILYPPPRRVRLNHRYVLYGSKKQQDRSSTFGG